MSASYKYQTYLLLSKDNGQVDAWQRDHVERDRRFVGVQQPVDTFKLYGRVKNSEILFHQMKAPPVQRAGAKQLQCCPMLRRAIPLILCKTITWEMHFLLSHAGIPRGFG